MLHWKMHGTPVSGIMTLHRFTVGAQRNAAQPIFAHKTERGLCAVNKGRAPDDAK